MVRASGSRHAHFAHVLCVLDRRASLVVAAGAKANAAWMQQPPDNGVLPAAQHYIW
jgi:hypothetical protein